MIRSSLLAVTAICSLGIHSATAQTTFPALTADDLNGRSVTLPSGLPGDPTIVFFAYKQDQQFEVNSWVDALGLTADGDIEFVELPVVGAATVLIRPVVDNGMRSGIVDPAMRARTITVYQNVKTVNAPLGFSGRDEIRVLLVRQSGEVLWSMSGPATAEGAASLMAALKTAQ